MRVFVDTNLWADRLDRRDPEKSTFVRNWMRELALEHDIVISTQVLIELRAVLTSKLKPALSWHDTRAALEAPATFEVVPVNASLVLDAHELPCRTQAPQRDPRGARLRAGAGGGVG